MEPVVVELDAGAEVSGGAWSTPMRQQSGEHCVTWASTYTRGREHHWRAGWQGRALASTRRGLGGRPRDWEEGVGPPAAV